MRAAQSFCSLTSTSVCSACVAMFPCPVTETPQSSFTSPQAETKAYTLILPQSTLSRRQSLNLELQFTSPRLGLCFLFCPECSFCFSFKKITSVLKEYPIPCHFSIWSNDYFLEIFYQELCCTHTINLLMVLIHGPLSCVCVCSI